MITGELVGYRNKLNDVEIEYHLIGKGFTKEDEDDGILYYFFDYETTYDHQGNVTP